MENNQLYHHGILGMRWGVRRYQNKDGSLTAAGKKRKRFGRADDTEKAEVKASSKKKSVSEMSDSELRERITRLQLEKQYSDLSPKKVSAGKTFVDKVLAPAAMDAGKNLLRDYISKQGKKALGLGESNSDADIVKRLELEFKKLNYEKQIKKLRTE